MAVSAIPKYALPPQLTEPGFEGLLEKFLELAAVVDLSDRENSLRSCAGSSLIETVTYRCRPQASRPIATFSEFPPAIQIWISESIRSENELRKVFNIDQLDKLDCLFAWDACHGQKRYVSGWYVKMPIWNRLFPIERGCAAAINPRFRNSPMSDDQFDKWRATSNFG